ncbi:MAG: cystathionine beta-synthase [Chaenotheca gracillima]|nr:MAG: cystathionine beta-synthase [Chaenotheca gracillima]
MAPPRSDPEAVKKFLDGMLMKNLSAFTISSTPSPVSGATTEEHQNDKKKDSVVSTQPSNAAGYFGATAEAPSMTLPPPMISPGQGRIEDEGLSTTPPGSPLIDGKLIEVDTPRPSKVGGALDSNFSPFKTNNAPLTAKVTAVPSYFRPSPGSSSNQKPATDGNKVGENALQGESTAAEQTTPMESTVRSGTSSAVNSPPTHGIRAPPPTPERTLGASDHRVLKTAPSKSLAYGESPLTTLQGTLHKNPLRVYSGNQPLPTIHSESNLPGLNTVTQSKNAIGTSFLALDTSRGDKGMKAEQKQGYQKVLPLTHTAIKGGKDTDTEGSHFTAWPAPSQRDTPAASAVRRVHLRNLPATSTFFTILSLVSHGPIESLLYKAPSTTATVYFLDPEDCKAYSDATANGIPIKNPPSDGKDHVVFVEPATEVDPVNSKVRELVDAGATRCVRTVGLDRDWDSADLYMYARMKKRRVENIEIDRSASGARRATFRFCSIQDAVRFRGSVERDVDWEQCNVHFCPDPCAKIPKP